MALVPVEKIRREAPLFYSADAETTVALAENGARTTIALTLRTHQGRPEKFTVGLAGEGEVTAVTGNALKSWAVRETSEGKRFLDLFPKLQPEPENRWRPRPYFDFEGWKTPLANLPAAEEPRSFQIVTAHDFGDAKVFAPAVPTRSGAVALSSRIEVTDPPGFRHRTLEVRGLAREDGDAARFFGTEAEMSLRLKVEPETGDTRGIEWIDPELVGRLTEDAGGVSFTLTGAVRVREVGASMPLLSGAALASASGGRTWRVRLSPDGRGHELVGTRVGDAPEAVELRFDVPVAANDDWRRFDFLMPAGVVVPMRLEGFGETLTFSGESTLFPERRDGAWRAWLNAAGRAKLEWKSAAMAGDGTLFFSSDEVAEVRVGAGLLRQTSEIGFRVLQGKLETLRIDVVGDGEVLSVEGDPVLGWTLREEDGARFLEVELSRPIASGEKLAIAAQTALGGFPVRAEPMRFAPAGALRHSGHLRVGNEGAVKLEVIDARGLMQLAPGQFPGGEDASLRQRFVYRFPSGDYDYAVAARQVLPEVGLSEVTIHEMAETDRRIHSDLELDIREAPLREWTVGIPDGFAVASAGGANVADYSLASEVADGVRALKILFSGAVEGRQLIELKLERNESAETGDWSLPRLRHDEAKSTRGFLGVAAAPGYRVVAAEVSGLAETPVDYFPKQVPRLQQAFRIREPEWSATMAVEALPRSVQADVLHLYSLREGVAHGSVLVNYFVVGAPASEWRLRLPESAGNVAVTGRGVGRDWRRDGDELVVPLTRSALGAATLLVTFEQPMSARGGTLRPGETRVLGAQSERGYVQVTSPFQVDAEVVKSDGPVLRVDPSELPAEYRLLTSAPTLEAWQYTAADVDLEMEVSWFERGEAVGEVIDFAALESRVSRDGQVVTAGKWFARSKGAATLEFTLPEGAGLWEAKVAGERVNARQDGRRTLVPLPRDGDPGEPVEVALRYGQTLGDSTLRLAAPEVGTATTLANWTVRADEGRRLIPKDTRGVRLVRPALTETGFEWIATRGRQLAPVMLLFAALGVVVARIRRIGLLGAVLMGGAAGMSLLLARHALTARRPNLGTLEFTAPAVLENSEMELVLGHTGPWLAMLSWPGAVVAVIGFGLLVWALLRAVGQNSHVTTLIVAGLAMIGFGVLAQHGGAVAFFAVFGIALLGFGVVPTVGRWLKSDRGAAPATAVLALLVLLGGSGLARGQASAESLVQDWRLADGRLDGELVVRVRADEVGERFHLLSAPAVLTGFESSNLEVIKEGEHYLAVATKVGAAEATAGFRMPVDDPRAGWTVPTGSAAVRTIYATTDRPGWRFGSEAAAAIREDVGRNGGRATEIRLLPGRAAHVFARPRQRDASREAVKFFTETADCYIPGPGVVDGRHRVRVRPAQGVVETLRLTVPEGFIVGEVDDGPVGRWRFNPETRELRVAVEPGQSEDFDFRVSTQRATSSLPVDLTLSPLRVAEAEGAVGMLGLAFGGEARPEGVEVAGMGAVNLEDFPGDAVPRDAKGQPLAVLQQAFRYGADEASVSLKVTPVAPEVRAEVRQTVSLGTDRLVVAADLDVEITRAGVFRLAVGLPEGLEVESVTGPALSHWTKSETDDGRVLTLNLAGRTRGAQTFALTLSGPSPGAADAWEVPRLAVRGAARQRGALVVVPARGLQVRAVARRHVSPHDGGGETPAQPGALSYRLLQADWSLALEVRELDPWVTAEVLHRVTLREGQALTRARLRYRIENAARKSLRVRLPGLDERAAATVRASGPAVGDFAPVDGEDGLWEIRFQRGVVGETAVDIEFQRQRNDDRVTLEPLGLEDVRQLSYFLAVETGGRLDAGVESAGRGWRKIDWSGVPPELRDERGDGAPDFVFRVAEAEGPLTVGLARHDLAASESLRGVGGKLTTLMAADGASMTAVRLDFEVAAKSGLRLRLPGGARPFNLLVNGEGVPLVREDDAWLFYVSPSPLEDQPAEVAFSYSLATGEPGRLIAPRLNVPLENLVWDVFVPGDLELVDSHGDFRLEQSEALGGVDLEDYREFSGERRARGRAAAAAELDQAYEWLKEGRQDKAGTVLGRAARNEFLDDASNEDARVQFRNLKMRQAVLGLNTRRQRIYLDNRYNRPDAANQQIEQAAEENPILQGSYNFDPRQFERLMVGNSPEETSALREIATRIVEQQLEGAAGPESLDIELQGQGRRLRFTRSLQVEEDRPMELNLVLRPARGGGWIYGGVIGLLAAVIVVLGARRRRSA